MLYEILQTTLFVNHEQIFAKTKYLNVYILFVTISEFVNKNNADTADAIAVHVLTQGLASTGSTLVTSQ